MNTDLTTLYDPELDQLVAALAHAQEVAPTETGAVRLAAARAEADRRLALWA